MDQPLFPRGLISKEEENLLEEEVQIPQVPSPYTEGRGSWKRTESFFWNLKPKDKTLGWNKDRTQAQNWPSNKTEPLDYHFAERLEDLEQKLQKQELKAIEEYFRLISYSDNFSKYEAHFLQIYMKMQSIYSPHEKLQIVQLNQDWLESQKKKKLRQILDTFKSQTKEMKELKDTVKGLTEKINLKNAEIEEIRLDLEHYQELYEEQRELNRRIVLSLNSLTGK